MITMRVIRPSKLNDAVFRAEANVAVERTLKAIQAGYDKTEATWKDKALFTKTITNTAIEIIGQYMTDDKIVRFLDEGTRVRYATLSPDWKSKTQVRWIGSGPGSGRVLFVSRKHPRPGIKARRWTEEIKKAVMPLFKTEAQEAYKRAAKRSGHGIGR